MKWGGERYIGMVVWGELGWREVYWYGGVGVKWVEGVVWAGEVNAEVGWCNVTLTDSLSKELET